jgi:hypothetical protein
VTSPPSLTLISTDREAQHNTRINIFHQFYSSTTSKLPAPPCCMLWWLTPPHHGDLPKSLVPSLDPPSPKVHFSLPMALLSLDLQSGLDLQLEIWRNFHQPVCFSPDFSSGEFLLVASFGRCKFHLDCSSVGSLLQSALGGSTADFNVVFISDQVFRFSVSCKDIGLFIYHLNYFKCDSFVVYFHLWNNGGVNWQKEFQAFQLEEIDSWQTVQQRKQSYADIVCKLAVTRANAIPLHHQKER